MPARRRTYRKRGGFNPMDMFQNLSMFKNMIGPGLLMGMVNKSNQASRLGMGRGRRVPKLVY